MHWDDELAELFEELRFIEDPLELESFEQEDAFDDVLDIEELFFEALNENTAWSSDFDAGDADYAAPPPASGGQTGGGKSKRHAKKRAAGRGSPPPPQGGPMTGERAQEQELELEQAQQNLRKGRIPKRIRQGARSVAELTPEEERELEASEAIRSGRKSQQRADHSRNQRGGGSTFDAFDAFEY